MICVHFNDLSENIFLLARLFNLEFTDNIFSFTAGTFSEIKCRVKYFSFNFDYAKVFVEKFS